MACGSDDGREVRNGSGTGTGSTHGSGGGINLGDGDGGGSTNGGCNEFQVNFGQEIPNVVILVDRSGSMWELKVPGTNTSFWDALKPAVLSVVESFQDEVKFSLSAYSSPENAGPVRGPTCPVYVESDPPALNNLASIQAAYDSASVADANANETPTIYAIEDAMLALEALGPDSGPKHILLVTDGQPDYCDSAREACAVYEAIGVLQKAYSRGIPTTVVGLVNDNAALAANLQLFANAGAGAPVNAPQIEQDGNNEWHCWQPLYGTTMAAHPPTFSAAGENATVHIPERDTSSLEAALATIIKGVKSCAYQLEGQVKIDPDSAHLGKIFLQMGEEEVEVPFESGWTLEGESTVKLLDGACTDLKSVETTGIRFDFPCDVFVR